MQVCGVPLRVAKTDVLRVARGNECPYQLLSVLGLQFLPRGTMDCRYTVSYNI